MKQGRSVITLVMVILAVALCVYFGVYAFNTFNDPFTTTLAYAHTVHDSVKADGLLVREEQVFPAQAGIVEITRGEGEKVGAGQTVAMAYRDSQAQADQAELDALAREIELLEFAATDSGGVESAARLDEDILQSVVTLRSSAALDDYSQLEDQVMDVKSNVLKRGYTYGDGVTAADLSARIRELKSQYSALSKQTATATTRVRADRSGTFSALVDGYEERLTPAGVMELTPSGLDSLIESGSAAPAPGSVGKLIRTDRWYFATAIEEEAADRLRVGEGATLRFTGDFTQDVEMEVERIGKPEEGRCLVVFSTDRYLSRTTLLRRQTAELIFDSWSGLRVPKGAVHMVKVSYEDEDTGETVTENRLGVYALLAGRAEFKRVDIVTEATDYYVVQPQGSGSRALRAGDEIILETTGLYDGQLLQF